jgi:DNA repair exonuclease SbcCD ATPase subunit
MRTMTLRGASEYLGISKNRIWRAVKEGHLPAEEGRFKGQKALTVSQPDLDEWAKAWLTPEELEASKKAFKHSQEPSEHLRDTLRCPQASRERLEAPERHFEVLGEPYEVLEGGFEVPRGVPRHSEATLREDLVAALERSHQEIRLVERRAIELELQLRQHKMLLTENAESLQERDARVKEAEAKLQAIEDAKQAELDRLTSELEATRAKEAQARENEAQLRAAEEASKAEADRLQAELQTARHQLAEVSQKPSGLFSWLGLRKKRTSSSQVDKAV